MISKRNVIPFVISVIGGGLSILAASIIGLFGLSLLGIIIGVSVGVMKKSFRKGIAVSIFGALFGFLAGVAALFGGFMFKDTITVSGIILGGILGGGIGLITGYTSIKRMIRDSIETIVGGVIGGAAAISIISYVYKTWPQNSMLLGIAGAAGGAIIGGAIIISIEIAERNDENEMEKK